MASLNESQFYKILPFIGQIIVLFIGLISFSNSIKSDIIKNSDQARSINALLLSKISQNKSKIEELKKSLSATQVMVVEIKKNTNMYIDKTNDRQRNLLQKLNDAKLELSNDINRADKEIANKLNTAMVKNQQERIADQQYNASEREKLTKNNW